jgi:hypothetical protein
MSQVSLCVNSEEIEPQAAAMFAGVGDGALAARAATLAAAALREDPACRRPPRARHYAGAHKIAEREALALGRPRHIVVITPHWRRRLEALALSLQDVCVAAQRVADLRNDAAAILSDRARRLMAKAANMNFHDLEARAGELASLHRRHLRERAVRAASETPIYGTRTFTTRDGAQWRLIRSCVELMDAGAALRNCWAGERPLSARYQDYLRSKQAEFWALWPPGARKPTRALMLDLKQNAVVEARGPCNAEVNPAEADLLFFLEARACTLMVSVLNTRMTIDHSKVRDLLDIITRPSPQPQIAAKEEREAA